MIRETVEYRVPMSEKRFEAVMDIFAMLQVCSLKPISTKVKHGHVSTNSHVTLQAFVLSAIPK